MWVIWAVLVSWWQTQLNLRTCGEFVVSILQSPAELAKQWNVFQTIEKC
jgi:hypothetical protein